MKKRPCVFTIPAGQPFSDSLARGILDMTGEDPLALAQVQILLPTRRACRTLREAFLKISNGRPLLLPRMSPLGDIDEEELSFSLAGTGEEFTLPPAMPPLQRLLLLTQLIEARGFGRGIDMDMALAAALAQLMDQVYTQNLDVKDLNTLVEGTEFARHWQISLDFLALISEHWPGILRERGMIDAADRRNRLLTTLAEYWQRNPPSHKIIAAGSTGSIPATAELLKVIAGLPDGCIVLPGLDQTMDDESWAALDDTHPQATLKNLLKDELATPRQDVAPWPAGVEENGAAPVMRVLVSEIMRPAETSAAWQNIGERLSFSPKDLPVQRYDCAGQQEEALVIALAMRGVLETPGKTAALVTPDRTLARRVAMACRRWGIDIDDSGGEALPSTRIGTYLRLCMEAACAELKPVSLLAFCKHTLCRPAGFSGWQQAVRRLDRLAFRGVTFTGGFQAAEARIAEREKKGLDTDGLRETLSFIHSGFAPLLELSGHAEPAPFLEWLDAHLDVAERFCNPVSLWTGEDGEQAAAFLSSLREEAALLPPVTAKDYLSVLDRAMQGIAVRPSYGLHPRLMILGQLEARLTSADVMILGGLNEGSWPPKPAVDPWMSRPMRRKFKLPPLERSTGLAAHDFAQTLCAGEVILTRSVRVTGTPTVPSRWLQRLDTVLSAAGHDPATLQNGPLLAYARLLDHAETGESIGRPAPKPPVSARPRRLSVTRIETWMNDPYGIYARHILGLEKLKPLEQPLDAATRGDLLHKILEQFVAAYPASLPQDALPKFMEIARAQMGALFIPDDVRAYWEPRLAKVGRWLIAQEQTWRQDMRPLAREVKGTMELQGPAGPFTLSGIVDRIDLSADGSKATIIDYKSGGSFTIKGMVDGKYPQLPLEALIMESGGFGEDARRTAGAFSYWVLSGGGEGGKETTLDDENKVAIAKENASEGLQALIDAFDDENTPYYSLPRPDRAPRFNDYKHLARVLEWTALDEQDSEEDAA